MTPRAMIEPFLQRVRDREPALRVVFSMAEKERPKTIPVEHHLGATPDATSGSFLSKTLGRYPSAKEFRNFYAKHNGLRLCCTHNAIVERVHPLLAFLQASEIAGYPRRSKPEGDRAWVIDLNKTVTLYRRKVSWIVFAEIETGPACLTMFLTGPHAGRIFYLTPQPPFNILRPIADSFNILLARIGADPAAFMRLVRASVVLEGTDREN